jgi:squalene-hopene/tetraprenyl-beta-curcumene cyclase
MTYALLKTYTLAGVAPQDARVQAAVRWIEQNWSLEENPGADPRLPDETRYQGLYYYYMVLAQALDTAGLDRLRVPAGDGGETVELRWRELLAEHLAAAQAEDGSWVNERNGRWWENGKGLCTIYALLALDRAR